MPDNLKNNQTDTEQEEVYKTAGEVNEKLSVLETFIARRFDEISMEINASAMQADMAEEGISQRFSEILETIGSINYSGGGSTAANTGVELEAVIKDTETAANNILDATDRVMEHLGNDENWNSEDGIHAVRANITNDIQDIIMACTFQDLAGQRIKNTLNNLHDIEDKLNSTFEKLGIDVKKSEKKIAENTYKAVDQDGVDSLFDGGDGDGDGDTKKSSSQGDIDSLFD